MPDEFDLDKAEDDCDAVYKPGDAELWFWLYARRVLEFARERSNRVIELETGSLQLPGDLPEFKL